jgi:transcriptional regulator with XRE-family HTH domain
MTDDVRATADPVRAAIGANVRAELARRGIPQVEISRIIGISQRQVSDRILGRVGFEVKELLQIAKELDVPVERLASLDDLAAADATESVTGAA